jgi:hypothetical protein
MPTTAAMLKLTPMLECSRIGIADDGDRRWSMLAPEIVSGWEACYMHCHVARPEWIEIAGGWSVRQTLGDRGLRYQTDLVVIDHEVVDLTFTLFNDGDVSYTDAEADFCFAHNGGAWCTMPEHIPTSWVNSAFHGPRKERNTEWTQRSFVATQWGLKTVGDINVHYAVPSNRQVSGENLADLPIILCQSIDRTQVYAAGWERCSRLYCAMGGCIHTVVWLGTLPPRGAVTRHGRFYYMATDPYQVLARFQRDFADWVRVTP